MYIHLYIKKSRRITDSSFFAEEREFRDKFNRGSLKRRAIITNYLESQNNDVPPRWLMPSGIAARLRKNNAFVQQILFRNSSDINYYNVDSSGPWQSVHLETGSRDSMDYSPKDSTNFRISFELISKNSFASKMFRLNIRKIKSNFNNFFIYTSIEIRYQKIEIELLTFHCAKKLAPDVDAGIWIRLTFDCDG